MCVQLAKAIRYYVLFKKLCVYRTKSILQGQENVLTKSITNNDTFFFLGLCSLL
jgi:hypothetical protein